VLRQCSESSIAPYADVGNAINAYLHTKYFDLDEAFTEKYFRSLDLQLQNLQGALDIQVVIENQSQQIVDEFVVTVGSALPDGSLGTSEFGLGLLGTGEASDFSQRFLDYLQERLMLNADGVRIRFVFGNNSLGQTFTLLKAACEVLPYGTGRQSELHIH
jgi:hypothetical protein